jgi:hypothetical protein
MLPSFALSVQSNPETLALLQALTSDEQAYQEMVLKARQYDSGEQFIKLTDRLRQFLGGDTTDTASDWNRLRLNVSRIVVTAVVERLLLSGIDTNEQGTLQPILDATGAPKLDGNGVALTDTVKPEAAWAWDVWQANRMDAKQRRVHEACIRDSESFVIVDWDNDEGRPCFIPHNRFIDGSIGGDNEGCKAFYRNDDPDQELLFVTKRWTEVWYDPGGGRRTRQRLTVYFPDRIEKYEGFPGAWQATQDVDDTAWPIPWLHRDGTPLGIPIAHFRSSAGMEAREAWPAQNAINFLAVLELAAADMTAFRILVALGWKPVDADGNPLPIDPGTWVGTENPNGKVQVVDPADISPISALVEAWVFRAAMVTDTPISRFIATRAIAAAETIKAQEGPLVNKVRSRQGELGNAWEDCLSIARRLNNTFGPGGMDETPQFYVNWENAEVRDRTAEIAQAVQLSALGVPFKQLMTELGYDAAQIEEWAADKEAQRQQMLEQMQQAPPPPQPQNGKQNGQLPPAFGQKAGA